MKLKKEKLVKKIKVTFIQKREKKEIRVMVVVRKKSKSKPVRIKDQLIAWTLIKIRIKQKELG